MVRKIVLNRKDKENKENKRNDSICNSVNNESNMNLENNINDDIVIYNKYNKIYGDENIVESAQTMKDQMKLKDKNDDNDNNDNKNNISDAVNNKLKYLYIKLKNVQEKNKNKPLKCRICFTEGDFEGNNPLISPCNCIGSVRYIHLNCLRKWLTSKVNVKSTTTNNIYCYTYTYLECEICKALIPEQVEYRGKIISLLDFKDIEPPYLILQTINQYSPKYKNIEFNAIFVISFKIKNYLIIGRANNSDIKLNDISVSRNHSIISYNDGAIYIDDIGSKFGTLLLIQNNILFLPYKEINIQTGKCHLIFYLLRSCLGWFRCYKNKMFDKLSYENNFNSEEKKVYSQILDNLINNIIDPIEKFSSINNSSNSESEINAKDEIQNTIKRSSIISNENGIKINNDNMDKRPTLNINDFQNKDITNNRNNTGSFIIKRLRNSLIDENNNNINFNDSLKQNESNEILFHEINNKTNFNFKNIKRNATSLSIMNILKKNNKKAITHLNKKFYNLIGKK